LKAAVHTEHGSPDVLKLTDIDRPPIRDDEVLVRVRAAAVPEAVSYFGEGHAEGKVVLTL